MSNCYIKEIYAACETVSERGDVGKCLGFSFNENVANKLAEGKGWYGGKGSVEKHFALVLKDEIYLLQDKKPIPQKLIKDEQVLIDSALSKLTKEEREALGF